jgi:hypothetical protein
MSKLNVTLEKLERYAKNQGGYDIYIHDNNVTLSFVPVFPEVLEKGDTSPPRVVMTGTLRDGKIDFYLVEVEDGSVSKERSLEESEMIYQSWLDYIEENF